MTIAPGLQPVRLGNGQKTPWALLAWATRRPPRSASPQFASPRSACPVRASPFAQRRGQYCGVVRRSQRRRMRLREGRRALGARTTARFSARPSTPPVLMQHLETTRGRSSAAGHRLGSSLRAGPCGSQQRDRWPFQTTSRLGTGVQRWIVLVARTNLQTLCPPPRLSPNRCPRITFASSCSVLVQ